jgi:phosphoglycolate phosphatase-like HAD superfamily hydrolase
MRFDAVVFDLDGTLIDSEPAKRAAFFTLFPGDCGSSVGEVLRAEPQASRYEIIPRVIARLEARGVRLPPGQDAAERIEAYGRAALAGAAAAPELPGATALLRALQGRCRVYVSSGTPEPDVRALLEARGWRGLVDGVFGHPRDKSRTLAQLVRDHGGRAARLAVVGDGDSDERAAAANGCAFFRIRAATDLAALLPRLAAESDVRV